VSNEGISDGKVRLVFAPEGRDDAPLTEAEIGLVRWAVENQAAVHDAMLQALFDRYPRIRAEFLDDYEGDALASQCVPLLKTPEELKALIGVVSVYIHPINSSEPFIGVEFGCEWDDEHGLGILLHGARPLEIGHADTAIYHWIAEKRAQAM